MMRHKKGVSLFNVKRDYFKNSFFPSAVTERNKLDSNIRNSESLTHFKKRILALIRPFANSTFQCHNNKSLKLITRLRLVLSHLRFHKFKHSFRDTLNHICKFDVVTETAFLMKKIVLF